MEFWKEFKNFFGLLYNLFENWSLILGKEIGRIEGKKYTRIHDLYQLYNGRNIKNVRTPLGYKVDLNNIILTIKNIKNALVSHERGIPIPFNKPQKIEIWDGHNGRISFRKILTKTDLYDYLYCLLLFIRNFQRVALSEVRKLAEELKLEW